MERKFYTDNFEQLLKEKSDEFRMYPSKRVWHSIYNDLHPGRKWPSIAVSMVLILALLMVGYWNNNNTSSKTTIAGLSPNNNSVTSKDAASENSIAAINGNNTKPGDASEKYMNTGIQGKGNANPATIVASGGTLANTAPVARQTGVAGPKQHYIKNATAVNANLTATNSSFNQQQQTGNSTAADTKLNAVTNSKIVKTSDASIAVQNDTKATVSAVISSQDANTTDVAENVTGAENNSLKNTSDINDISVKESTNKDFVAAPVETKVAKPVKAAEKRILTANDDKAWIEDYAFHNKSKRKKWQDRTAFEIYIAPSIGYRSLTNDSKYNTALPASPLNSAYATIDANKTVSQTPALGLEAGFSIAYSVAKNLRIKAGLQANYTNYGINAEETNHPVVTTLLLVDPNTGSNYIQPVTSTLANTTGAQTIKVHSKTYQVSLPIGAALKLGGNNKLEWYAGASIQPTAIIGSKSFLISADRKNYVEDPSLLRKWNLNAGFETYINYKFDGFTLQAGPQFRYQLLSTFKNTYTVKENLYNLGLKIGILKNF